MVSTRLSSNSNSQSTTPGEGSKDKNGTAPTPGTSSTSRGKRSKSGSTPPNPSTPTTIPPGRMRDKNGSATAPAPVTNGRHKYPTRTSRDAPIQEEDDEEEENDPDFADVPSNDVLESDSSGSSLSALSTDKNNGEVDDDDDDDGTVVMRRSARRREKESQSWITGGGSTTKGYPKYTTRSQQSLEPEEEHETGGEAEAEDDNHKDCDDLYTRIKKRGRRSARFQNPGRLHYSPHKAEPYRDRLRTRKPKSYNLNYTNIVGSLIGKKKTSKYFRVDRSQNDDSSSSSDDDEMVIPKKKKAKLCSNNGSQFVGSRELYEPLKPDPGISFQSIGGLNEFIRKLREVILFPMLYKTFYESRCIKPPRGVLFYGPPGTGKTLMARAVANEATIINGRQVSFFMLKGSDILSKWVGESEKAVKQVFESAAKRQPSIIFFDEIDGLAASRSIKTDQFHNSLVSTFLAELDGLRDRGQIIVIGATNRIDALDPAFRRAGRFDYELQFRLPDHNARREIIAIHTSSWPDAPNDRVINEVSSITAGYNGADLKLICSEACLIALKKCYPQIYKRNEKLAINYDSVKVSHQDFIKAIEVVPRSSARSTSSCTTAGIPLTAILKPLLQSTVDELQAQILRMFPYLSPEVYEPSRKRIIVYCDSEFIVPAVLHTMDTLPVITLSPHSLSTTESESRTIIAAFSEASVKPGILYIPDIAVINSMLSQSARHVLLHELNRLDTSLLIATSDEPLPTELAGFFQNCEFEMCRTSFSERLDFFESIFKTEALKVRVEVPEVEEEELEVVQMELTEEDVENIEKYENTKLRELRIFLRDTLEKLARNRKFVEFTKPVDVYEVTDYLSVIKNPMDFETMMGKVNMGLYLSAEMFLSDINLIVDNAIEYNPPRTDEDKRIRHRAFALRDVAYDIMDKELDSDFEDDCKKIVKAREERKKLLADNESRNLRNRVTNGNSKKITTPKRKKSTEVAKAQNDADDLGFIRTPYVSRYAHALQCFYDKIVRYTENASTVDLLNLRYKLLCACQQHYSTQDKDILLSEIKQIIRIFRRSTERRSSRDGINGDRSVSVENGHGEDLVNNKNQKQNGI